MTFDTKQISKRAQKMNLNQSHEMMDTSSSHSENINKIDTSILPQPTKLKIPIHKIDREIDFEEEKINSPINDLRVHDRLERLFSGGPQRRSGFKLAAWTWIAFMIDALLLASMTCFLTLGIALGIEKFKWINLYFIVQGPNLVLTLLVMGLFLGWMYFIASRVLVGATVGEWTCALRMGQPSERMHKQYLYRIVLRTSLTLLTGLVPFPMLSLLLKKDILGQITGVSIYSLK